MVLPLASLLHNGVVVVSQLAQTVIPVDSSPGSASSATGTSFFPSSLSSSVQGGVGDVSTGSSSLIFIFSSKCMVIQNGLYSYCDKRKREEVRKKFAKLVLKL